MIQGFHVQRASTGNVLKWVPHTSSVTVVRYRVALTTIPPPWGLVFGDRLTIAVPAVFGESVPWTPNSCRDIIFEDGITTPDALADYINALNFMDIRAQVLTGINKVSIYLTTTSAVKFIRALSGSALSKLGLDPAKIITERTEPVELISIMPTIPAEYNTFTDFQGLPGDQYALVDTVTSERLTWYTKPYSYKVAVCVVTGVMYTDKGIARQNEVVKIHSVPPQEPDSNHQDDPLTGIGWPFSYQRPLTNSSLHLEAKTDENGYFQFVCPRGLRLWIEVPTIGFGAAFDVPDAPSADINALPEWRRTGMLGPYDAGSGAATANLGGGNSDA